MAGGAAIFETAAIPAPLTPAAARAMGDEAIALARETGWRSGEAYALLERAFLETAWGDYGAALAWHAEGEAVAREIGHGEWMTAAAWTGGVLRTSLLDPAAAHDQFVRAAELGWASGSRHWEHVGTAGLAESFVAIGDLDQAGSVLARTDPDLPLVTIGQRRVALARARLALASGDAPAALALASRLRATANGRRGEGSVPHVSLFIAECLIGSGRPDEAKAELTAVAEAAATAGWLPLLLRAQLAMLRLDPKDAALLHAARATGDLLAESIADPEERAAYRARLAQRLPATDGPKQAPVSDRLTRREGEIARLIALGRSNRQIADALSVSERTVETHVSHILAKLGAASRVEIATWVVSRDDTPDDRRA